MNESRHRSRSTLWRHANNALSRDADDSDNEYMSGSHIENDINVDCPQVTVDTTDPQTHFNATVVDSDLTGYNVSMAVSSIDYFQDDDEIGWRWLSAEANDESDSSSDDDSAEAVRRQLAEWSVQCNIKPSHTKRLLKILKPHFPSLPLDCRTLVATPINLSVECISGGEYCHVGLEKGILHAIENSSCPVDCIELQVNVDGIPLFNSSSTTLWPILCSVKNLKWNEPFVVGLFCGRAKPGNAAEFMSKFITDANYLIKNGLTFENKTYSVKIHSFVCDAPARAFLKGIKSHSGYSSCEKCTVYGVHVGKVVFLSCNSPLRTDADFVSMKDENHHVTPCPLSSLNIGFVSQFGLDYMHMACLGVMRRFILYWKGPVGPLAVRLGSKSITEISKRLLLFAAHSPIEFARKTRGVDEILRWKATELRQFLLYSGPFILDGILPSNLYAHFMLLFVGMRILSSKHFASLYCDYANDLLVKFVSDSEALYGKEALVYNVHSMIHLAADVKVLGCIEDFSAFRFENKLGHLKKLVRKPQQPIQQICRRLDEQLTFGGTSSSLCTMPVTKHEHSNGPVLPGNLFGRQFKQLQTGRFTFSLSDGNNCIMTSNGVPALVKNIIDRDHVIYLVCSKFRQVTDAFDYPCPSSKLFICKVKSSVTSYFTVKLDDVFCKCIYWSPSLSKDGSSIVLPLLH